jgi:hypothetical protein
MVQSEPSAIESTPADATLPNWNFAYMQHSNKLAMSRKGVPAVLIGEPLVLLVLFCKIEPPKWTPMMLTVIDSYTT